MANARQVEVHIINAFVDNGNGGNPAGVVFNADGMTNEQKLSIAKQVGLSETAFVSKSKIADYKLDFFTPNRQIAHCGHATVATFSYLSQQNAVKRRHSSKETTEGTREILIKEDLAFMEQRAPRYEDVADHHLEILNSLGLSSDDLLPGAPICLANTGNSFLLVPIDDTDILKRIKPNYTLITALSEKLDLIGYYVFCIQASDSRRDASTRMFAPRYGIAEEAGTGMAAGPLACYLRDKLKVEKDRFLIEQGWYMAPASPSLIIVDLVTDSGSNIIKVMAGGKGLSATKLIVDVI